MSSRRQPLLWLQCLSIGAIPMELLMLRLVLAGADLGPFPGLERLFIWAIGVVVPAVLFWKRPPDWASLLFVRHPIEGRSRLQRQLNEAQMGVPVKVLGAVGVIPLLILLWWIDASALLVADLSPLHNGNRLGSLLLAIPLLSLVLWQWHQLVQSCWLLTRDEDTLSALVPSSESDLQKRILSLGMGVLRLTELDWDSPQPTAPKERTESPQVPEPEASHASADAQNTVEPSNAEIEESILASPEVLESIQPSSDDTQNNQDGSGVAVAVEPEQAAEQDHSPNLDRQVGDHDAIPSADPEAHHEQSETSGTEQCEPEQPPETSPGGA